LHRLQALQALEENKPSLVEENANKEELKQINLTELADVLLLAKSKVQDNEVTPILNLLQ
jgi:hypothetical protein